MAERRLLPARPPLVGRDTEIETVQDALDRLAGGHGRLLLVSGEPGIGKTRLVEELTALATGQGALVAWGRADDADGAPPYRPWTEILEAVLDGGDVEVADAGPLAAILPVAGEAVPPLDPVAARFRLHDAVVDLLARVAAHRSLVLVLDDLHWADPASLELVRFAASRLTGSPVLLVLTYRSVDADRGGGCEAFDDALGALARVPRLTRLPLQGLTPAEVGRFMDQTIGLRSRPAAVTTVHARTEGNPFFVGELARLLHSEGLLGSAGTSDRSVVPVGVRDVVRRRLVRLPEPTGKLLGLASVLGREFDLAVLAAAADLGPADVVDGLEPALAAGLVQASLPTVRFSHALIRDTVYEELGALRRATLHARVGEVVTHVTELAWHFFHAAPVVGPEPGLTHLLEAAGAAQAALAFEQAEDDLRRALGLVEAMPAGAARLERELHVQNRIAGLLLTTRGQGAAEFGEACTRARELCTVIGESDDLFGTLFGLSLFHATNCEYTLLAELGAQLLAVGRQRGHTAWLMAGHLSVGCSQLHAGSLAAALADLEATVQLARELTAAEAALFAEHPLTVALQTCALVAWFRGDDERAQDMSAEAVALAAELTDPLTLVDALYSQNKLAVLRGDPERVLAQAGPALALCEEHGLGMFHAWVRAHRGWALCHVDRGHDGRCEEGLREIEAGLVANQAGGGQMNTPLLLGLLADGEALAGRPERALAAVDDALAVTLASEGRLYEADLHRRRGEFLAALGRPDEACAALRTAVAVAGTRGAVAFGRRAEAALATLVPAPIAPTVALPVGSPSLSPRERTLLALVGQGRTDKEIAAELVISLATVRSHLDRIRDKTGRRRRAELTRLAVDLGVIQP